MNQEIKDKLASALGIPKNVQEILDVGGDHLHSCRCNVCKEFWRRLGPEEDGQFGPFSPQEMMDPPLSSIEPNKKGQMAIAKYKNVLEPNRSIEFAEWKAKGFSIVISPPDVLQLDFDSHPINWFSLQQQWQEVCGIIILEQFMIPSKTKWHFHQYVRCNTDFGTFAKIENQFLLNSDPARERINFYRAKKQIEPAIVFLEQDVTKIPEWAIESLL